MVSVLQNLQKSCMLLEKQKKNLEKDDLKNYLKLFPKASDRGIIEAPENCNVECGI